MQLTDTEMIFQDSGTKHDPLIPMLAVIKSISAQMPRSYTLIHTTTFADGSNRCFWETRLLFLTPPCQTICGFFVLIFLLFVWFQAWDSWQSCTPEEGSYDVFCRLLILYVLDNVCSKKINIHLCADFVPSQALCGVQCVSVSGSGPAPAPLSLCVFVCADLFQQFSFGQALGASSLSAPVWTQKPLTTFDSVNILVPFNMQPELLCKDEERGWWGVWWEGREWEGWWGVDGVVGVESECSRNLTLMVWSISQFEWKKKKL